MCPVGCVMEVQTASYRMKKFFLLMLMTTALFCATAQNRESIEHTELDEIVVSSNRWGQQCSQLPVKVATLLPEEVQQYNPQTAADMLSLFGGVFIQKSQYGGGSPMIRGFSTNRLLYSVDGVRMNTAIFRSGNIQNVISLDPFAIASTEVLFGPGSVSYGSDAIGGVMVFNTLRPRLSTTARPLVYGSATVRTATASGEFTTHVHAGVGFKKWSFLTSYTHSSFGDLNQGLHGPDDYVQDFIVQPGISPDGKICDRVYLNTDERLQTPSGYTQHNFMQKVRFSPDTEWNLEYSLHFSETSEYSRYDRHQRMRNGLPRYAQWDYGPQSWMMNHLRTEHAGENILYNELHLDIALQRFEESRISRDLNKPVRETQSEKVDAWSVNLDLRKSINKNIFLFYGAEYVQNNVESKGTGLNIINGDRSAVPSRYPEARWYSYGAYLQTEWHITSRLNFAAGLRYNHYRIDCDFSTAGYDVPFDVLQKSNAGNLSGYLGLNWHSDRGWLVRINYARGFRAPNVDDMGKLFDSADGFVTVPNPSLTPEYADNIELGIAKQVGNILKFDVTAYYTRLDDAIVKRDFTFNGNSQMEYQGSTCRVQALQNGAVTEVWGIQAAAKINFANSFYAETNANYQHGREELDNGQRSPSRHAAPLFGRASIGFKGQQLNIEAYTIFQDECSAKDMPEEEKEKTEFYALDADGKAYSPAWLTLNFRASLKIGCDIILNSTIENITDRRYRPYSCGISAPGRNFTFGFTYSF